MKLCRAVEHSILLKCFNFESTPINLDRDTNVANRHVTQSYWALIPQCLVNALCSYRPRTKSKTIFEGKNTQLLNKVINFSHQAPGSRAGLAVPFAHGALPAPGTPSP